MNKRFSSNLRPISDINIVPYVDVMLVLLVIFMVTAPMLNQGVEVELPQAKAEKLSQEKNPPVVVSVSAEGKLFLDAVKIPIEPADLAVKVKAALQLDPTRAVLVKGDKNASYGQVLTAMALLKQVGVPKVGLMTQYFEEQKKS